MAGWHYRYRRIIDEYREALRLRDPMMCRSVDIKMESRGEGWVCDDDLPDLDSWWTASEIAKKWGFNPQDVYNWESQGGFSRREGAYPALFRVGDVLSYFASKNRNL